MALITAERIHGDYNLAITDATGNKMNIDIPVEQGGNGNGIRPMQALLAALCGCSSVDIVAILKKQKQNLTHIKISVDGNREENKEPSMWQNVQLVFELTGDVQLEKAIRAADLSITKYCSVAETLRRAGATITYQVVLNGTTIL